MAKQDNKTKEQSKTTDVQVLKCRDDREPVYFSAESDEQDKLFRLKEGSNCSWASQTESFGTDKLRPRIEPWLTALFQTDHLSLLVGSGLTHAVYRMATDKTLPGMSNATFKSYNSNISTEAAQSATRAGRAKGNIEDQIRVANELLRGLEILASTDTNAKSGAAAVKSDLDRIIKEFATSILDGERGLVSADSSKRERAFNYLVSFLMSFASRTGTRDRLHVFTTNYDRLLEAGADIAGLRLLDRFIGSLAPVFRSSRLDVDIHYNPPGIRGEPRYLEGVARFTKLHGSLDWINDENSIHRVGVPFGAKAIDPYLDASNISPASSMQLMIYPNAAKDRETASYPYVELFRDLASSVCRPNSALVTYGYSFGDEHINRVIEDMLTIPSAHLVVISYNDPLDRILNMYHRLGRHAQVTLLIGSHLGDFSTLVDHYLPKPAIDRTTFRMAELLKSRWSIERSSPPENKPEPTSEEAPW